MTLVGHKSDVNSVVISSDNRYIVSGGYDATVRIWNFKTGEEIMKLTGHTDSIFIVVISLDGKFIVSGS